MKTDIDTLLRTLVIKKASDLHLQAGSPPVFRIHGELEITDLAPLTSEEIEARFVDTIMDREQKKKFEHDHHIDLSYAVPGVARFRVNVFQQRGNVGAVMRVIPFEIPSIDELGLPPIVKELASNPHGLILVANAAVRNLIKTGKTNQIYSILQTGRQEGMRLLTQSLIELCRDDIVTVEEAMSKVTDPKAFKALLKDRAPEARTREIVAGELTDSRSSPGSSSPPGENRGSIQFGLQ